MATLKSNDKKRFQSEEELEMAGVYVHFFLSNTGRQSLCYSGFPGTRGYLKS